MIHAHPLPRRGAADADRSAALRWVALAVLVVFVLFMVLGWAHAVGALGDAHPHVHGAGHDHGGDPAHHEPCRICDAVILTVGGALFVAFLTFVAVVRASAGAWRPLEYVRVYEPRRVAAPRGPPAV